MSSKTSAESPPEFFVDRSLGKVVADRLRSDGWQLNLIADQYPSDAATIEDEVWIAEGCRRGWALLTKDRAIRHQAHEIEALAPGSQLFCLSRGDWTIEVMVNALSVARPRIEAAVSAGSTGFWHVYRDGSLRHMWP